MNDWNAFVPGVRIHIAGGKGTLSGLTFSAKDLFDIKGQVTGNGCNAWRRTHKKPAVENAAVIETLLQAGATLNGRTVMDAMAWGAEGGDSDDPNPINPAAPERATGGSSSGSAVAVAAGLSDFAIGSDTACSIRLPAAYCGLWGIRPTHGRISTKGMTPLAPSMDTVGWMARSHDTLARVTNALLPTEDKPTIFNEICLVTELINWMPTTVLLTFNRVAREKIEGLNLALSVGALEVHEGLELFWFRAWSLEIMEAADIHGGWVESNLEKGKFAAAIKEGMVATDDENKVKRQEFERKGDEIREFIGSDRVLCLPTVLDGPPLLTEVGDRSVLPDFCGLSIATLAGLPQITIPLDMGDEPPLGLSLIGPQGSDRELVALAGSLPTGAKWEK